MKLTGRAVCAVLKMPLQRSHFSPSLPQEGFPSILSNFLTRLAMREVLVVQISPLVCIDLDDLGFLLDWQIGKQQSRPLSAVNSFVKTLCLCINVTESAEWFYLGARHNEFCNFRRSSVSSIVHVTKPLLLSKHLRT